MSAADGRTFLMAIMHVSGFRNRDIAKHLGYTEPWVSTKLASPLMQAQIRDLQEDLRTATVGDAMEIIEREAPASVQMLVDIRGTTPSMLAQEQNVQRQAANDLLDRHPKFMKKTHHEEEHTVRLVLSTADVQQMMRAHPPDVVERAEVIDVVTDVEHQLPSSPMSTLRTLDDSIRAAEEALVE